MEDLSGGVYYYIHSYYLPLGLGLGGGGIGPTLGTSPPILGSL